MSIERACQCPAPAIASVRHHASLDRQPWDAAKGKQTPPAPELLMPCLLQGTLLLRTVELLVKRGNYTYFFTQSSGFLTQNREANLCPCCSSPQSWLHTPLPFVPLLAFTGTIAEPIKCSKLAEKYLPKKADSFLKLKLSELNWLSAGAAEHEVVIRRKGKSALGQGERGAGGRWRSVFLCQSKWVVRWVQPKSIDGCNCVCYANYRNRK